MKPLLEQVREGQAPAEVAGVFRDIREELRITYVPLLFRALAAHPGALRATWEQLRPNVATQAFETLADELRARLAHAAVELGTPLIEPVLAAAGLDVDEMDDLREQVNLFHYADPKTLLCAAALEGIDEGVVHGGARVPPEMLRIVPPGAPSDIPKLALLPEEPGGIVGEIFHEVMRTLGLPVAEIDLRAFGHWPAFVEIGWREVGTPLFKHHSLPAALEAVTSEARRLATQLPFPIDPTKGRFAQHPETLASTARVVSALRLPLLRLALFVAALKVALDGAQEALDSPFAPEWERPEIDQIEVP